jgi:hypothetical protein
MDPFRRLSEAVKADGLFKRNKVSFRLRRRLGS